MKQYHHNAGISLVEILVSLAIFSIGIVGLYLSIQGMNKNLQVSMQRDVEATYANMLISEVNPYDIDIETAYDSIDNNNKMQITLPDGRTAYALRRVLAQPASADLKEVNIYFYRNANDAASSPYRHFKREIALKETSYAMRNTTTTMNWKDNEGRIWTRLWRHQDYSLSAGSYSAGRDSAITGDLTAGSSACGEYHVANSSTGRMHYVIPATAGHEYKVTLGFCEGTAATAGQRLMDVYINGSLVDSVDVIVQAGAQNVMLEKSYSVTPQVRSGVNVMEIELRQGAGATLLPNLYHIKVTR